MVPVSNRTCKVGLAPALNPVEGVSENSNYRHRDVSEELELHRSCITLFFLFFLLSFMLILWSPSYQYWSRCVEIHRCIAGNKRGVFSYCNFLTFGYPGKIKKCYMGLFGPVHLHSPHRLILTVESLWPVRSSSSQIAVISAEMLIAAIKGVTVLNSEVPVKC